MDPKDDIPEFLYQTLLVIMVMVLVTGTLGNSLTICALLYYKKLRTLQNTFLVNLAFSDLTVCSLLVPCTIMAQKGYIAEGSGFCYVLGYISIFCLLNSCLSLALIAFNRYVSICKSRDLYSKLFTKRKATFYTALTWLFPMTIMSPPLWTSDGKFGHYDYNPRFGSCLFDDVGNLVMYMIMLVFADFCVVFPSLGCSFFCYYSIVMKFLRSRKKVAGAPQISVTSQQEDVTSHSSKNISTNGRKASDKKAMALVKNLFTIFITFNICWFPMVLCYRIDFKARFNPIIYHIFFVLAQSNSCLNFIIYVWMNTQFRNAYISILTFGKKGGVK